MCPSTFDAILVGRFSVLEARPLLKVLPARMDSPFVCPLCLSLSCLAFEPLTVGGSCRVRAGFHKWLRLALQGANVSPTTAKRILMAKIHEWNR